MGFEILQSETVPYTSDWLNKLKIAVKAALEKTESRLHNIWVRLFLVLSKKQHKNLTCCLLSRTHCFTPTSKWSYLQIGNLAELLLK
jgi:anhydro-N-acetylmuramic acid kinase